jgi:putative salt-induced outer membrane protein YdiY
MHPTLTIRLLVTCLALASLRLSADTVDVKNGARIIGKITKIDAGTVVVSTDYAGTITIKQSDVASISTDAPIAVRLSSGTRVDGKVSGGAGALQIAGTEGSISTTMDKVAASWAAGGVDPAVARDWAFEAAVDIAGKTGNKEQLATGFSFRATLAGSQDTLQFYSGYDRQVADGVKSADQFKAGVDYANNFSGRKSWYVRNEGGFDRVKDIELYNIAAAGLGYDFIKEPRQLLTGRAGLSFRYAGYKNPLTEDVKSAGLDFGLAHRLQLDNAVLTNRLSYVPTFEDFSNFVLTHESSFEVPLLSTQWKLRLGVANDYNSQPGRGVERLDTTYFTRLVLNWR